MFADNYERSNSISHYHHLSIKERESILKLSAEGKGIREISRALGRSAGTISRELKRNSGKDGYWPTEAEKKYRKRRKKCCRKRILNNLQIKVFVQQKILDDQWSPEQIVNRAKLENSPHQVSYPTIYRAIYLNPGEPEDFLLGSKEYYTESTFDRAWQRIGREIDLHGATPHILRHTYLTIMGGTSTEVKTIQAIAGHADIKMTMERYVHRRVDRILEAGKKMEAAFHEQAAV